MSFTTFFQENILLFVLAIAVLGALMMLELRSFQTRGADVSASGLSQAVNAGAKLIDLRGKNDFQSGHIPGAKNIPFEELDKQLGALGDNDNTIVLYCYTGAASGKAVAKLRKQGYAKVKHLSGGMATWRAENLPLSNKS